MPTTDPALRPPTIDTSPGSEYASQARLWQGIPGIEAAANGRLWAIWYTGGKGEGPDNYVVLVTSEDDGVTWSDPVLVIDPPGRVRAFDPVPWHDPSGRLWLFWAQSEEHFDGRCGVWCITTDESAAARPQWTEPRRIADGIMMNKPIAVSDDEWLLPAAIWPHEPLREDMAESRYCNAVATTDAGETFSLRSRGDAEGRGSDEHMIVERGDGSLWMLIRMGYGIAESVSTDGGRTWSDGKPTDLGGPGSRFFIRRLQSGNLLLVNHHDFMRREGEDGFTPRNNLKAFVSDDDGRTWKGGLVLDERFSVSYPDGVQSADGTIRIIYDRERAGAKEILMAAFHEDDVLAGRQVASSTRMKMLVNRAG